MTARLLALHFSPASITVWQPGTSTASGFSAKMCFFGAEARRRDEQHGVDLRSDDFLVRVNPNVGALRIDFETLARLVELVLEIVSQRDDLGLTGRFEQTGVARALPAASDESNFDHRIGVRAANRFSVDDGKGRGCRRGGRAFQYCSA